MEKKFTKLWKCSSQCFGNEVCKVDGMMFTKLWKLSLQSCGNEVCKLSKFRIEVCIGIEMKLSKL